MKFLKIPVFFNNPDSTTEELKRLGIETEEDSFHELPIKDITFFRIDYIGPYTIDDKIYTCIGSGTSEFVSPLSEQEVFTMIKNNL